MERLAMLLGIDASIQNADREQIGHLLSISGQVIHDNRIENQSVYSIIGGSICNVLKEISLSLSISERLAQAGAIAGIWPSPLSWDRSINSYRPLSPFHQLRTRASPD